MCDFCTDTNHKTCAHVCKNCGVVGKHSENAHHTFKTIWELVEKVDVDNVQALSNDMAIFLLYVARLKAAGKLTDIKGMGRFRWIDDGRNDLVVHTDDGRLIQEINPSLNNG